MSKTNHARIIVVEGSSLPSRLLIFQNDLPDDLTSPQKLRAKMKKLEAQAQKNAEIDRKIVKKEKKLAEKIRRNKTS